ncbi:hypothetical protein WA026_009879 [Henosepilachna vigintioctopunctata]|uniref:UDP-glucuronosyltransferase n=1 Tax=Henosepilachna vigintioctopunctata TaxID=420089 RepID=A0AAW1TS73_9CUCU
MRFFWNILCLLCTVLSLSQALRILGVFPHSGISHFVVMRPLMKELAKRGHEVTVVSHFPLDKPVPRYKDISIAGTAPLIIEKMSMQDFYDFSRISLYVTPFVVTGFGESVCRGAYASNKLDEIFESSHKYDLMIAEMFNSDCFLPINHKLNIPIIGMSSSALLPWMYGRFGIPTNPSYMTNIILDHPKRLSFVQRLENTVITGLERLFFYQWRNRRDTQIARSYFKEDIPHVSEFAKNASLMLVNSHFTLNNAQTYPPNVIEVGGIHLPEKNETLPKNILKFIEESPHGVIFFSLGSTVKSTTMPAREREQILSAFARLPQRVLWKWESDTMPGKPDNVMIQKWMPQFDILSHPNVVAFICHGGLLGVQEAVYNGVPMLVMPQHGDQHTNAKAVEDNGGGIVLYLKDVTLERFYQSLQTILHPEFKAKAKALSERFRDRPNSPMDTAVYWVEYVARHKGAPHIKTAAVDMPSYQYLLLDVYAFLLASSVIAVYIWYRITRSLLKCMFVKKKVKQN